MTLNGFILNNTQVERDRVTAKARGAGDLQLLLSSPADAPVCQDVIWADPSESSNEV